MAEWSALPATVRECWMLIKGWEAQKVKEEHDTAERERKRSQASAGGRAGRTVTRTPL